MPNRGGFSWKRLSGYSAAKTRISRRTGIPFTRSGRQRKLGRMVTGGGCLLPLILLVLALLLATIAACAGPQPAPAPAAPIEVTRLVEVTVPAEVTRLVEVEVTRLIEVTSTPEPTPTPAPQPAGIPIDAVIAAFRAAGLEAEDVRPLTKDDYGMAPMMATEALRFYIPALGEGAGGRLFAFANQADLETTQKFYVEMGRASALAFSWTFARANILVQINGDLPEDQARKYEKALQDISIP